MLTNKNISWFQKEWEIKWRDLFSRHPGTNINLLMYVKEVLSSVNSKVTIFWWTRLLGLYDYVQEHMINFYTIHLIRDMTMTSNSKDISCQVWYPAKAGHWILYLDIWVNIRSSIWPDIWPDTRYPVGLSCYDKYPTWYIVLWILNVIYVQIFIKGRISSPIPF